MKTFKLKVRQSFGEGYWCSDDPSASTVWLGYPLVCAELGHLAGLPKNPAVGTEATVEVSTRKIQKGRLVELLDSGDWLVGRAREVAANRVSAFLVAKGLPRKFYVRVKR